MTYVQARTTPGLQTPGGLEYTLIWGVSVLLVPDISHGKDPMLRQGCTLQEAGSREGTGTVLQSSAEDRAAAGGQDICCEWFPPGQGQHPGAIERPHRCTAVVALSIAAIALSRVAPKLSSTCAGPMCHAHDDSPVFLWRACWKLGGGLVGCGANVLQSFTQLLQLSCHVM